MNESEKDLKAELGRIIAAKRKKLELTQEQLADECGTARNYIGELERGEKQPTITTLFALAEALQVTPADIMRDLQKKLS